MTDPSVDVTAKSPDEKDHLLILEELQKTALLTTHAGYALAGGLTQPSEEQIAESRKATQPFEAAISNITTNWSMIERVLDSIIWDLADVRPHIGSCLTGQLGSVRARLITLEALHKQRIVDAVTLKQIRQLQAPCRKVGDRRNRAVHDPIAYNHVSKIVMVDRFYPNDLRVVTEPADLQYYKNASMECGAVMRSVIELGKAIQASIPPLIVRHPSFWNISPG